MGKIIELIGGRFVDFFTRSVAPSSIFFILLFFNDMYFNDSMIYIDFLCYLNELKSLDSFTLLTALILLFLSYGYVNAILSQFLDYMINWNYTWLDKKFIELRDEVKKVINANLDSKEKLVLDKIDFNDYNAYQVLGKDISVPKSYVDDVKSIHALVVSLGINIIFYSFVFTSFKWPIIYIFITMTIGWFFSRLRYKARNKRLYINYLLKN